VEAGKFYLHHHVHNSSGAHPVSYPVGTRSSFPGGKVAACEDDHSPPSNAEVMKAWAYTTTPPVFMVWCLIKQGIYLYGVLLG